MAELKRVEEFINAYPTIFDPQNLPVWWKKQDTLLYYSNKDFKIKEAKEILINHIEWIRSLTNFKLTRGGQKILKQGVLRIFGKDKNFRPILYIICSKIEEAKKTLTNDDFVNALVFVLILIKKYCLLPFFVEKWDVVLDLGNISAWKIDTGIIKAIINITKNHFVGHLHRLYFLNPHFTFSTLFSTLKSITKI